MPTHHTSADTHARTYGDLSDGSSPFPSAYHRTVRNGTLDSVSHSPLFWGSPALVSPIQRFCSTLRDFCAFVDSKELVTREHCVVMSLVITELWLANQPKRIDMGELPSR